MVEEKHANSGGAQNRLSSLSSPDRRAICRWLAESAYGRGVYCYHLDTFTYWLPVSSHSQCHPLSSLPPCSPWLILTLYHRSVITDYLPRWRVPKARRFFDWSLNLALLVVGWGWYEFETNDVGLTEAVRRIWTAKRPVAEA